MSDLIEFLEARIAEDEAAARAATEGPWGVDKDGEVYKSDSVREVPCTRLDDSKYISTDQINVTCDSEGMRASVELENATHIARHDPARVLREVASKRALLEHHGDQHECTNWEFASAYPYVGCSVLRELAAVYSDHPDYRKEWAHE